MKHVAENLTGLTAGKPSAALKQENKTLDKILHQWVPEIWEYPDQLARIRQYVLQGHPDFPETDLEKIDPADLQHNLSAAPPYIKSEKLESLILMLDGMIAAMQHFKLQSGEELSNMIRAHKAAFLADLNKGHIESSEENRFRDGPGASRKRRKS